MRQWRVLIVLALLSACTPQQQLYRQATHAPTMEKDYFVTADNVKLPLRRWLLARPRAIVIGVHGFNDYSNAFTGAGEYFKKRGIATYAYDQRGFGQSGERGIWAGKNNLTRDLRDFTVLIARRYPKTPVFIMGESMGGAVTLLTDAEEKLPVSGLVLVAPAVWGSDYMPPFYHTFLWSAARIMPSYKLTGRGLKILASNNMPMLQAMGNDPLVIKATRIDTIYGLVTLMDDAYHATQQAHSRILLLYGYKDQVIPRAPIEAIKQHISPPSQVVFYDKGYHMLTRDLQGKDVMRDIADWMLRKH